jgi:hypothetical protein
VNPSGERSYALTVTCIVRLGHVATMNGFVQALYEKHRFATKFDRPMPQKPLFHGHNLNWSGPRESNRRMQLGSCSCLMNSRQGHSRRVRGVHIRSSLHERIRPERWVTFLAFLLMRKLRRGFRRLAYIRRLAEVAAEAAELDEPELVATLRQLVQAVIVHAPPGTGELAIEITASLSELTLPGPLLKRSSGG